ncbi:hypothetical protein [Pseudonocardia sp. GCM10023141]|uniref:hypothetical protein n=1 Tax=Pseudonocardia sp. GCM10023141 TaxID=3252653 RepID=UPI003612E66A
MTELTIPTQREVRPRVPSHRAKPRPSLRAELAAALTGLAVLAWLVVQYPFWGDHAVFALMGRQILQGEVLYTQLWDIKQPGIFLWYGLVDLLGFGEIGSRVFDVLAALALGALVRRLLWRRVATPWVRRWVPALVPAALFLGAGPGDFGQLEILCLVPAVGAFVLVAAVPGSLPTLGRLAGAGVCLGVVGVFKLPLAAVPAAAIVLYLLLALPRARLASIVVVTAFAVLPVSATLAWLGAHGALDAALHTWIVDAADMGAAPGSRSLSRLAEGALRYVEYLSPAIVLGLWQAGTALRRRDPLDLAMAAWIVVNVGVIALQFGWWYQWYSLSAPLLILAIRRLDALAPRLAPGAPRRALAVTLVAAVCVPMLAHGGKLLAEMAVDGGGFTAASRARIAQRDADQGTMRAEIAAVGITAQDRLYVLGNPLYNYLSDHPLVVRTDGWGFDLMSARQWQDLAGEVQAARPTLVLVQPDAVPWIQDRGAGISTVLAGDYTVIRTSAEGTWYRLRA